MSRLIHKLKRRAKNRTNGLFLYKTKWDGIVATSRWEAIDYLCLALYGKQFSKITTPIQDEVLGWDPQPCRLLEKVSFWNNKLATYTETEKEQEPEKITMTAAEIIHKFGPGVVWYES